MKPGVRGVTGGSDEAVVATTSRLSSVGVGSAGFVAGVRGYGSGFLVTLAVGLVAAGQLAEDVADSPPIQMLPPAVSPHRWAIVLATLYIFVILRLVERTVRRSLPVLEPVVGIDVDAFRAYARQMAPLDLRVSLATLGISALVVALLFLVLQSDLPLTDPVTHDPRYLPSDQVAALLVLAGYTVVGWAGLMLVTATVRLGTALGRLSREPFDVDVFDTSNLVPFGNIALAVALAPAGVIFILLVGLGQPQSLMSWTVLLLAASASVLALLLPLRPIHGQMSHAKLAALAILNQRISQAYSEATAPSISEVQLGPLNQRTNTLIPLRQTVQEMTTWPFRNTVAFGRAILIASAPLIYTALGELIKVLWIAPLTK